MGVDAPLRVGGRVTAGQLCAQRLLSRRHRSSELAPAAVPSSRVPSAGLSNRSQLGRQLGRLAWDPGGDGQRGPAVLHSPVAHPPRNSEEHDAKIQPAFERKEPLRIQRLGNDHLARVLDSLGRHGPRLRDSNASRIEAQTEGLVRIHASSRAGERGSQPRLVIITLDY